MTAQLRTQANSNTTEDELKPEDRRSLSIKLLLLSFGLLDIVIRWAVRELSSSLESQFGGRRRSRKR